MKIKKKYLIVVLIICLTISTLTISCILIPKYKEYKERKEYEKLLESATIIVNLKDKLSTSFYSKVKVSDFISYLNGEIIDDYYLDTTKLGELKVNFEYMNDENIKIPYEIIVNVVDDISPVIWVGNNYSVTTDYEGSLLEDIVCADNYDDYPVCEIVGDYNTKIVGEYPLLFQAKDASGNLTKKNFTLRVKEPNQEKPDKVDKEPTYTYFSDVVKKHKKNKNS